LHVRDASTGLTIVSHFTLIDASIHSTRGYARSNASF
jgi:hypothetical protein